jgi:hypothetical protein
MRILRPAALAAALGAVLLCTAVQAQAGGSTTEGLPSVSLSPNFAQPGESISVTATCRKATSTRTLVTSGAFDPLTLLPPTGASEPILTGTIRINHVHPGHYTVTSTCDDSSTSSTTLTVLAVGAPHVVPEGAAHTGGGSTAPNRPGPPAGLGAALLGSGVGLVAVTLRRRAARR